MGENIKAKRSRREMETIRLRAVQAVLAGESPKSVSQREGCHRSRIYAWLATYRHEGETGLRARPVPGRPSKKAALTRSQQGMVNFDELVPLLYRSVLDTDPGTIPWRRFLYKLSQVVNCLSADIYTDVEAPGTPIIGTVHRPGAPSTPPRITPAMLQQFVDAVERCWPSNPLLRVITRPGDMAILSHILPRQEQDNNPYCREILRPAGRQELLGLGFAGPGGVLCLLQLSYGAGYKKPGKKTQQLIHALLPHLETAMEVFVRIRQSEVAIAALKDTASRQGIATFILDGNGYLIQSNEAGQAMIDHSHLHVDKRRLTFSIQESNLQFQDLVRQAITWRLNKEGSNPAGVIRCQSRQGVLGVLVQPIIPPHSRMPLSYTASINPHVIVHIADPQEHGAEPSHHIVAHLFDLPIREAHLATLLADGHSLPEAAATMNITVKTARTYLQRIYSKLGINRQTELLQLILKSVALLA